MLSNVSRNENLVANKNLNQMNNTSPAKAIVLCNKGEAGYCVQMDLDEDGILTLDEFNEYCNKNGISGKEKVRLLSIMQTAKTNEKIIKESQEENEQNKESEDKEVQEDDSQSIYARRGESKYNEKMDENKDSKITYAEYEKYCEKQLENNENKKADNSVKTKELKEFQKKEIKEPEISVEVEA